MKKDKQLPTVTTAVARKGKGKGDSEKKQKEDAEQKRKIDAEREQLQKEENDQKRNSASLINNGGYQSDYKGGYKGKHNKVRQDFREQQQRRQVPRDRRPVLRDLQQRNQQQRRGQDGIEVDRRGRQEDRGDKYRNNDRHERRRPPSRSGSKERHRGEKTIKEDDTITHIQIHQKDRLYKHWYQQPTLGTQLHPNLC